MPLPEISTARQLGNRRANIANHAIPQVIWDMDLGTANESEIDWVASHDDASPAFGGRPDDAVGKFF